MQSLHAVADTKTFDISAALASREIIAVRGLMAAAGIEQPTAKFKLHDLDQKLSASNLSITQRIQVKLALSRANLLD